ncbi:hypothetical protein E5F05_07230 [Deinococcus metallilatus]|uniref:ATP-dependent DNA helicase RecG n=1 Tax=Deinococcus metallilatus TaxID=1211322 RepID=A0AAJ5F4B3_9DEIO|nr:ATP-binding protein [Deinococcus metallilatus]MBB5297065.1 ATP-dependent DNA helicase RecG [Deinococcus metallilatus]QBY07764.1 hypothetical protein E5F05_07230 [Deinococcus metallilatus]RXJ13464.1 hypothetical protein ERJ73_06065 [Deinococcus metallilatus]TLK22379.1 hypothetical protein FCS05_17935 [Deinococcus metallilatus]GMA17317.1 ATPase AAA [Deinococcus metallilatus]
MTEQELRDLIAQGETLTVEFKSDVEEKGGLHQDKLVEAIVCMANTHGGQLLLGVEDSGEVTGLNPERPAHLTPANLEALIANRTRPHLAAPVGFHSLGGHRIVVITVPKAAGLTATSDGLVKRRVIGGQGRPECVTIHPTNWMDYPIQMGAPDLSAYTPPSATWDDLDPIELERLRQNVETNPKADPALRGLDHAELAGALNLVVTVDGVARPTVTGLLLAGREASIRSHVPTHEAAFQLLTERLGNPLNQFSHAPLVKLFQTFEQYLVPLNLEEEFDLGIRRIPVPPYPTAAFREGLANALVHRDYTQRGTVYVRIDEGAGGMYISNPGRLPEGVTTDNILVVEPRARNPLLADAFRRLGLAERTGRGVDRIYESILRAGRPAPTYEVDKDGTNVRVFLPGGQPDVEFVRLTIEAQNRQQRDLTWRQLLILRTAKDEGEITTAEATALIRGTEHQARSTLEQLMEAGLLEPKGPKKHRTYHLSARLYNRMGQKAEYVRRRGPDSIRQEQSVLQFLREHGEIQRSDVLKLLPELTPSEASNLLKRLTRSRQIAKRGERKGTSYTLGTTEP